MSDPTDRNLPREPVLERGDLWLVAPLAPFYRGPRVQSMSVAGSYGVSPSAPNQQAA